jgi:thioredoxin reductase
LKGLIVIGAGPSGLTAAWSAARRGFEVLVLEAGVVGQALRRWGRTRLFSPVAMNVPPALSGQLGLEASAEDLLTGPEMVERILGPLTRTPELAGRVRERHRVVAVGRAGLTRLDFPGHPLREERRFCVLVRAGDGDRLFQADAVLDASGVTDLPNALGPGGLPARGESSASSRFVRSLGALEAALESRETARFLLVGHGHSAANAVVFLEQAARHRGDLSVVWAVRARHRRPCEEVANDPLPERSRVVSAANALAENPPPWLRVERQAWVECLHMAGASMRFNLTSGATGEVDCVGAFTGYRPDLSFLDELQLEISPVTGGPAPLARALSGITDCLSVPNVRPSDLGSGEPGFHMIGAKSYGRSRTFLLKTGFAQTETILDGLA